MRALVSRPRELPPQPLAGRVRADCKADGRSRHEEQVRADPNLKALVGELKGDPQLESILRQRQQELGIDTDSRLMKVVRTRSLKRALSLSVDELERGLGLSR